MLKRQQGQLVAAIHKLYQRLQMAGLWEQPVAENLDGKTLTHDILAALDLLEPKEDGSGELEIFSDVVRSCQSDDDTMPFVSDGDMEERDRHDSIVGETSSLDTSLGLSPRHPQHRPTPIRVATSPSTQTNTGFHASQTQFFTTSAAAPIYRSACNISNASVHNNAATPSLSMDPRVMRHNYPLNQAMATSSLQSSFCYERARNGIMLDSSDFSTDFH
jgi:hypothetical protein